MNLAKENLGDIINNFQNVKGRRLGEIDIIAKTKNEWGEWEFVFVEVKTRIVKSGENGVPEENIDRKKLYKLQKIAQFYIRKNNLWNFNYRFDAISVILDNSCKKAKKIRHLKNIFL